MPCIPTISIQKQQRGVVLVVSLMVLLVLTLLGISSLDGSIMEEKMAANAQTSNITFQQAESAIRQTFYVERKDSALAYQHAENSDTESYNNATYGLSASTVMSIPSTAGKQNVPCRLTSFGEGVGAGQFRAIEIIGNANIGDINSRHTQGYHVCTM